MTCENFKSIIILEMRTAQKHTHTHTEEEEEKEICEETQLF